MSRYANATVFTTGQIAKICKVAPRTVSKWFDTGRLKGYRIPGSQDRRVPRENLIAFLREHGLPLGELEPTTSARVLLIGVAPEIESLLLESLPADVAQLRGARSGFEAGALATSFRPHCVVLDTRLGTDQAMTIARLLKQPSADAGKTPTVFIVALLDRPADASETTAAPFDERFRKPFDPVLFAARIRSLCEVLRRPA